MNKTNKEDTPQGLFVLNNDGFNDGYGHSHSLTKEIDNHPEIFRKIVKAHYEWKRLDLLLKHYKIYNQSNFFRHKVNPKNTSCDSFDNDELYNISGLEMFLPDSWKKWTHAEILELSKSTYDLLLQAISIHTTCLNIESIACNYTINSRDYQIIRKIYINIGMLTVLIDLVRLKSRVKTSKKNPRVAYIEELKQISLTLLENKIPTNHDKIKKFKGIKEALRAIEVDLLKKYEDIKKKKYKTVPIFFSDGLLLRNFTSWTREDNYFRAKASQYIALRGFRGTPNDDWQKVWRENILSVAK